MATPRNYLNNPDLLKEIHLSKNTYCSFLDPATDHQYDLIVQDVNKIKRNAITEARENRAKRIKKETGTVVDPKKIPHTDLVFRVMTYEHIPLAPKKVPKSKVKKQKVEEIFSWEELVSDTEDDVLLAPVVEEDTPPTHLRLNFPPFQHYRLNEAKEPFLVGRSHWSGDLTTGSFNKDHGQMTDKLARMFLMLCERYATRSNWRGYTYNAEMKGTALLQLSQIGLKFDESKSDNPFAYFTAAITNSFTRVLNEEKKNQNIRDDILEINGLNPSWSRQFAKTTSRPEE